MSKVKLALVFVLAAAAASDAHARRLVIVHTNDLHSRLLGFAPDADYTPLSTNDDATVGGFARMATVIRAVRDQAPDSTLVLDGGDLFMGTLFHTLARETGQELRLLHSMGYDAGVIGNHEFDLRPAGLARILESAAGAGPIPAMLLSNIRFDPADPADDGLQKVFERGLVRDHVVLEKAGLRIGIFGLLGVDAAEVEAPYSRPVRFDDPVATARKMADRLRNVEKVDLVICVSHGGVVPAAGGGWEGEDIELAKVPGVDVVVGGHTHTPLPQAILVGDTPVVQAGCFGRYVGVLELDAEPGKCRLVSSRLIPIDDSVAGAPDVHAEIEAHKHRVEEQVLRPLGLQFDQVVLQTAFDLELDETRLWDSNLGPFAADAIRTGIDRATASSTDVALTTAGVLRDSIRRGQRGLQQTSDVFRIVPLGVGSVDPSVGVPLTRVYVTARELRNILEVLSLAHEVKGLDYFPFLSGLRFRYNRYRVPLDRVHEIELGDEASGYLPLDQSASNTRLYSLGLSVYLLHFVGLVEELSHGLLSARPKDASGTPIRVPEDALLDADPQTPGIQEVKEWVAVLDAVRHLPDTDGNGIPDMPERYARALPRMIAGASLDPVLLLRNTTGLMAGAILAGLLLAVASVWASRKVLRRLRRRA